MTKICIGCGKILQSVNKDEVGYTPNIKNDYCMRCFRLKNYGEKKEGEIVDEAKIIAKINAKSGLVFFLIDYLNLNSYTLNIFKSIKIAKVLVISKSDTLRREMKFNKIKSWLNKVYNINEDIVFISNKNGFKNVNIFKYMDNYLTNSCYIMGITNAGKSTFINSILKQNGINKEIVTSSKPNTTLDFIKLKIDNYLVYDTPGFNYLNSNYKIINDVIKPITFKIEKETTIIINNAIELFFATPNSVTIYTSDKNIRRVYKNKMKKSIINNVKNNSDIVIPGIGFINVKNSCEVLTNIEVLEIRPNISGEDYE